MVFWIDGIVIGIAMLLWCGFDIQVCGFRSEITIRSLVYLTIQGDNSEGVTEFETRFFSAEKIKYRRNTSFKNRPNMGIVDKLFPIYLLNWRKQT